MLGIIINPRSGKPVYRRQRIYLWKLLRKRHQPFVYRVTQYVEHATELACELVKKGCNQILVLGGDGSLSEVINGIMRADITAEERAHIRFGLMPRGTGNDWARFWGLDKNYKRSLELFFSGKQQYVDVGCMTYSCCGVERKHYFINSIGLGVDSITCVYAAKLRPYIGSHHFNYLLGLFIALWKIKPLTVSVIADGREVITAKRMFHLNIANGPYNGGGMKQHPNADPRDGILQALFVEPPTFRQVLMALPRLFNGGLYDLPFVHVFEGKTIQVQTRKHVNLEADGILKDITGPLQVTCLHHALEMIVPSYCEENKEIHDFA